MTTAAKVGVGIGVLGLIAAASISDEPAQSVQSQIVAPAPQEQVHTIKPMPKTAPTRSNCHPSYSGCLKPDASDYDCAGGSGNGPYYTGAVRVLGPDVFGLDRDGDGWGCE